MPITTAEEKTKKLRRLRGRRMRLEKMRRNSDTANHWTAALPAHFRLHICIYRYISGNLKHVLNCCPASTGGVDILERYQIRNKYTFINSIDIKCLIYMIGLYC